MTDQQQKPVRRVRIQNDSGIGHATQITDADTGQSLQHIYHARIVEIGVNETLKAVLWAHAPAVDVIADAETVEVCPHCGQHTKEPKILDDQFRLKLSVGDIDLDLAIDKMKRLRDLQRATRGHNIYPAEALFAFIDWVRQSFGNQSHAPGFLEYLKDQFCEAQSWDFDPEYWEDIKKRVQANYPD